MIGNFQIRQGSTLPWLEVQISKDGLADMNLEAPRMQGCATDACGDKSEVVDLTNCQVRFELFQCGRVPAQVGLMGIAEIMDDPTCGWVRYKWAVTDLPDRCLYYGTFVITMPDNTILRWPYAREQLTIEAF